MDWETRIFVRSPGQEGFRLVPQSWKIPWILTKRQRSEGGEGRGTFFGGHVDSFRPRGTKGRGRVQGQRVVLLRHLRLQRLRRNCI
jgi:hypothetical protein